MSGFIDTSMTVRYLVNEPVDMAERATTVIEGEPRLFLTEGTIIETAFVLSRVYRIQRVAIVDGLIALIRRANIQLYELDKALVIQGLEFCRPSGRVSIPDALLWAAARSAGIPTVYSFDQRFPSDGVEIRQDFL